MPDITLKAILEATKLKRKKGIGRPVTESFGDFNISEPSNFAPNGRSYHSNPADWKEKHEYAKEKLSAAGFRMHGCSPWNSTWSNADAGVVKLDYWNDFDVIRNIVETALQESAQPVKTEDYNESTSAEADLATIVSELNEYLADNHHRDRVHETTDGRIICEIENGDWKHEHLWFRQLVKNFMEDRGYMYKMAHTKSNDSEDDTYSATYYITVQDAVIESRKVESLEPLVKTVSISFDAQVPVDYTEKNLEEAIKLALETKGILVDSYMEIHTNE